MNEKASESDVSIELGKLQRRVRFSISMHVQVGAARESFNFTVHPTFKRKHTSPNPSLPFPTGNLHFALFVRNGTSHHPNKIAVRVDRVENTEL